MKFYTNVFSRGDRIYVRGYDMGMRFTDCVEYKPYVFMLNENASDEFKTLDGKKVSKIPFASISDARKHIEKYKDVVFAKINIDKSEFSELVDSFEISSIPLLHFYHKGKLEYTVQGTKMTQIIQNIDNIL